MENKMIERINQEIEEVKRTFEQWKDTKSVELGNARIQGMLTMLEMATGKSYYYDNDGLHERN